MGTYQIVIIVAAQSMCCSCCFDFVTAASMPFECSFSALVVTLASPHAQRASYWLRVQHIAASRGFSWLLRFQRAPCFYCRMRQVQQLAQPVARCLTPLCPLPDRPVATPCSKAPLQAMQPPMQHLTCQTYRPGPGSRPPPDPPGSALLEALLGLLEGQGLRFLLGGLSLSMAPY